MSIVRCPISFFGRRPRRILHLALPKRQRRRQPNPPRGEYWVADNFQARPLNQTVLGAIAHRCPLRLKQGDRLELCSMTLMPVRPRNPLPHLHHHHRPQLHLTCFPHHLRAQQPQTSRIAPSLLPFPGR